MTSKTKRSIDSLPGRWKFAAFCAVLAFAGGVRAQVTSKPFSADMIKTSHNKTTTAKVNVIATAIRTEGVQNGQKFITIMRYDRNVLWSIMPDQKMYFEMPIPAGAQMASGMKEMMKGMDVKRESLGSEQVNGFLCDKTKMIVTWQGITATSIQWAAKDLGGFTVKTLDERTGDTTEYKDIHPGPQDASLFELPAGFKKMDMRGMTGRQSSEN